MEPIKDVISEDINWNIFNRDGSCPYCGSRFFLNSTPERNRVATKNQLILTEHENTCGECGNITIAITNKPFGESAKHYQFAIK